jgi:hypothetical protein
MDTQNELQPTTTPAWPTAWVFVVTLAVALAAASIGATNLPGPWYEGLVKPGLTPPNWVFGPVWTVLYLMMGWAAGLVWWQAGFRRAKMALGLYLLQLGLMRPGRGCSLTPARLGIDLYRCCGAIVATIGRLGDLGCRGLVHVRTWPGSALPAINHA